MGICGFTSSSSNGVLGGIRRGGDLSVGRRRAFGGAICLALFVGLLPGPLASKASGGSKLAGIPTARPAICSQTGSLGTCLARAAARKKPAKCAGAQRKSKSCVALARKAAKKKAATKKKPKSFASATSTKQLSPDGLGPEQIRGAYSLPSAAPLAQTIAIVTAFDDPNAESDLGVYSSAYSLPSCTSASGCFRKVNGLGHERPLPPVEATWALETSLDVQVAHGVCPNCKILLVEAASASILDLLDAIDTAVALGANEVSNSWVVDEFSSQTYYDSRLNHPGVVITAASGDTANIVQWPASSSFVTAVGGTTLTVRDNVRVNESAWQSGGSGCSRYESKPAWQTDGGCQRRMVPDVVAVGDPSSGAAVYDSYGLSGRSGWFKIGGTSLGAPVIAAVYALAGNADQVVAGSYPYAHGNSLFDIRTGVSGSCSPSYLCTTGIGYDGPTGLGSPNGTSAF